MTNLRFSVGVATGSGAGFASRAGASTPRRRRGEVVPLERRDRDGLAVIRQPEFLLGQVPDRLPVLVGHVDLDELQGNGDFVLEGRLGRIGFLEGILQRTCLQEENTAAATMTDLPNTFPVFMT